MKLKDLDMPNKRDFERFCVGGKVKIILNDKAQTSYDSVLIDISSIGFCALIKEKLTIGCEVIFELRTSLEEMTIKGEGVVKNIVESAENGSREFRLGIIFTKVDKEDVLMLLNQIESRISEAKKKNKPWFNTPGISPM